MKNKIIKFQEHGDERGELVALESFKEVPFVIKRVYYIYGTLPNIIRGKHSHKTLEQILICINGSCKILLERKNGNKEEYLLDKKNEGLYIGPDTWREMYDFSNDAILLVLASEIYNENDYIRDKKYFLL